MKTEFTALMLVVSMLSADGLADDTRDLAGDAMKRAATYYHGEVATRGGYVYFYSLDLKNRWGEGVASKDQVWVQPPGTPTVGLAFLKAYEATDDVFFLKAATDAAEAIAYGQLQSGGWTNCIDFDPRGARSAKYRNGKGRGKDNSSLDDGQTQSALRLLINADRAHNFHHAGIHEAAIVGLNALLAAQFDNGGFPQVWTGSVAEQQPKKANYPEYDWRTDGRIKEYWTLYTLNDNVCGYVLDTLIDAYRVYDDDRYLRAIEKLGDFLILAQMPDPQPAWAQQYNYDMQPVWARRFEPPGISGDESQEAIETLISIAELTKDEKYLEPIPKALAYLRRSMLPTGQLARYYELKSNRPLYMSRSGRNYSLTYDDSNLPDHYGWKTDARLDVLKQRFDAAKQALSVNGGTVPRNDNDPSSAKRSAVAVSESEVRAIVRQLDDRGRWVSVADGTRLVGQAKIPVGAKYLSSEVFSDNLTQLAEFLAAGKDD